jgi:hypothetical protein
MTAAIDGLRATLLGAAGWTEVAHALRIVAPGAVIALAAGIVSFRFAARRERRRGTIGLY